MITGSNIKAININGNPAAVLGSTVSTCDDAGQSDHCTVVAPGTVITFPIQYPGQDQEQYKRDGGLPINVSNPAVYTPEDIAYRDQPKSLTALQWSASEVNKGDEVTLSCSTSGVREGAGVMFSIYPEGADTATDPPLMDIRGKNKGSRAEVKWIAKDIRKPDGDQPMKWFFTAWTLYCQKEESGVIQVLNPRITDVSWKKKSCFLGEKAELTIKSFEMSNKSPTISIELWEEDENSPDDFVLTQEEKIDSDEISVTIPFDFSQEELERLSDFDMDTEGDLEIFPVLKYQDEKLDTKPGIVRIKTGA